VADEPDRPEAGPAATGTAPTAAASSSDAPPTRRGRATRRRARRRRLLIVGAGAAAALAVAGSVAALSGGTSQARRGGRHAPTSTSTASTTAPSTGPTTTSVVPRSSNPVVALAQQYDGLYIGTFTNTTYHTSGTATLEARIDPTAGLLHVSLSLTGDLFGGGGKQVRHVTGTIQLGDPNAPVSMQTDSFGPVTGRLSGFSLVLTADNVPDPKVKTFQLNGSLRGDLKGFDATFTVGFRDGHTAQGVASVLCAVTGQRPSQVPTICASA
jgi:hypothetical protein